MQIDLRQGDCLELMKDIPERSVDLTVTSPPYDNLRNYNGNNSLWSDVVWKAVIKDLYRVTKDGGVVVWVVGDATIKGSETGTSFKQALWAKDCGFNLHDTMIYKKSGVGACGSNLGYWQSFEYMFVFTKGRIKTVNRIRDKPNSTAGTTRAKSPKQDRLGSRSNRPNVVVKDFGIRENVWVYHVGRFSGDDLTDHPAPFPESLAVDHIISWSNRGDLVFDPFMGSGTTGKGAISLSRNFIGIELDEEYFKIAQDRIQEAVDGQGTSQTGN